MKHKFMFISRGHLLGPDFSMAARDALLPILGDNKSIWVESPDTKISEIITYGFKLSDLYPTHYVFNNDIDCWNFDTEQGKMFVWSNSENYATIYDGFNFNELASAGVFLCPDF